MTGSTSSTIHSGRECEEAKPWTSLRRFASFLRICFALGVAHRFLELFVQLRKLDFAEQHLDRVRAHAGVEFVAVLLVRFAIFRLGQELRLVSGVLPGSITM